MPAMDDGADRNRTWSILAAIVVVGVILVGLTFFGGQTSKILSTVGASVGGNNVGIGVGEPVATEPPTAQPAAGGQVADAGAILPPLLIVRNRTLDLAGRGIEIGT